MAKYDLSATTSCCIFPGGFGKLDELFELLTLCQKGMKSKILIILFGKEYRNTIIDFECLADPDLIAEEHLNLFEYADTASEARKIIKSSKIYFWYRILISEPK